MLTKQNIIVNRKRLIDYGKCRYLCKNKQEFIENLSCDNVIEFAAICDSLGLEIFPRQVDYYGIEVVGRQSPYYFPPEFDGFLSEAEIREYESYFDSSFNFDCLSMYFEPVQLVLPFK